MKPNENELLYLYIQKDEEAFTMLCKQMGPIIDGIYIDQFRNYPQYTLDDWRNDARADLARSLLRYRIDHDASLKTFIRQCLLRLARMKKRSILRKEYLHQTMPVSLDRPIEDQEGLTMKNLIPDSSAPVHERAIHSLRLEEVLSVLKASLNQDELQIIQMLMEGWTRKEIADELEINPYKITSLQRRCRRLCASIDDHSH